MACSCCEDPECLFFPIHPCCSLHGEFYGKPEREWPLWAQKLARAARD